MNGPRRPVRRCRSGGAPIRFIQMADGRWMPANARPSELSGNILVQRGIGQVLGGYRLSAAREEGYGLYVSHFASCPGADQHRRDRVAQDEERRAARRAFARARERRAGQEALFR